MGLFSGFRGKDPLDRKFNTYEAASGILLSVLASDGEISDTEVEAFNFVANRHPIFASQSAQDFRIMVEEQCSILRRHGWEVLADKAASCLPDQMRGTLFTLAVDFVLADGRVEAAEENMIDSLREKLHISDEDARKTIEVLATKNSI